MESSFPNTREYFEAQVSISTSVSRFQYGSQTFPLPALSAITFSSLSIRVYMHSIIVYVQYGAYISAVA